jgi:exodeoxyribonuclease-1
VAPISVLDEGDGWNRIGLTKEIVDKHLEILLKHPEFEEKMREENENRQEYPPAAEPEAALYDGFLDESDRIKVSAVRNASPEELADFHPEFLDERLPELLLHFKGRNYPESLSEEEVKKWEAYKKARLERLAPKFLSELEQMYHKDEYIGEELKLYFESLFDTNY